MPPRPSRSHCWSRPSVATRRTRQPPAPAAGTASENQQLLQAAPVDWAAALRTARGELGDAVIDELDLSEEDGRVVWEVSTAGTGTVTTVVIDAASGDVIGTENDD